MERRGGEEKQCEQVPFEKVEPALRHPTPRWLNVGGVEPSNQSEIGKAAKRRRKQFRVTSGVRKAVCSARNRKQLGNLLSWK